MAVQPEAASASVSSRAGARQVGKQNLFRAQQRRLFRLRFLHFHDEVRTGKTSAAVPANSAPAGVIGIRITAVGAGAGLDQYSVAGLSELIGSRGQQGHPVFVRLYFAWYANNHGARSHKNLGGQPGIERNCVLLKRWTP